MMSTKKPRRIPKREIGTIMYAAQQFILSNPYSAHEDFNSDGTVRYVPYRVTRGTRAGAFADMYATENTTFFDPPEVSPEVSPCKYVAADIPDQDLVLDSPLEIVVAQSSSSPVADVPVADEPAPADVIPKRVIKIVCNRSETVSSVTTACELVSPSAEKPISRRLMIQLKRAERQDEFDELVDFASGEYDRAVKEYEHIPNAKYKPLSYRRIRAYMSPVE